MILRQPISKETWPFDLGLRRRPTALGSTEIVNETAESVQHPESGMGVSHPSYAVFRGDLQYRPSD